MKQVILFEFRKSQIPDLLNKMNMEIDRLGNVVHKETDEIAECYACGKKLKVNEVGNIMPGSGVVLCDNPSCFAQYCSEKGLI